MDQLGLDRGRSADFHPRGIGVDAQGQAPRPFKPVDADIEAAIGKDDGFRVLEGLGKDAQSRAALGLEETISGTRLFCTKSVRFHS